MRTFALLLLAVAAACVCAVSVRAATPPCAFAGFDFTSLTHFPINVVNPDYNHALAVCGWLTAAQSPCAAGTSACMFNETTAFDMGNYDATEPQWMFTNGIDTSNGVTYSFIGATQCYGSKPLSSWYTNVAFACGSANTPVVADLSVNSCAVTFTITTPLVCTSTSRRSVPAPPVNTEELELF